MTGKILGAILILLSCGAAGFQVAFRPHREMQFFRQLIRILDYMENELTCRLTPLPDLCRQISQDMGGILHNFFYELSVELELKKSPDAASCIQRQIFKMGNLPNNAADTLQQLGDFLGQFDLQGQLKGINAVRRECVRHLETLSKDLPERTHRYKTLGLCAGALLIILLI